MRFLKNIIICVLALMAGFPLAAQQKSQQEDSLVVLISAKSAQMVDIEGASYRKVIGPARFLHNDTYLLCDTALWNVETKIINAWGNVSILQEETVLTSERLIYLIDEDLAQFRGTLVQLEDKDHNTLRTRHLDYNTKDSVGVFMNGGAMRDKDGQIIESRNGTYDSKISTFTFETDVNMFTDSIFVKTKDLVYESDLDLATFGRATNVWKDDNMLSSEAGWYDRGIELFFFADNVHVMSDEQEGWCDSLYFNRLTTEIEMLGNAQVSDTTRNVYGLAGRLEYVDSLAKVTMTRKPAVISQTENPDGTIDTVYMGADKLIYYTLRKCDIDSMVVVDATKRLESLNVDPVGTFRKKAAAEAAKAAEEAAKNDPNYRPKNAGAAKPGASSSAGPSVPSRPSAPSKTPSPGGSNTPMRKPAASAAPPDSLELAKGAVLSTIKDTMVLADSLSAKDSLMMKVDSVMINSDSLAIIKESLAEIKDSLGVVTDSLMLSDSLSVKDSLLSEPVEIIPPDTTKIGFLEALGKVKIFKKDMQVVCDSMLYCDLDSLARLYKDPIVYQEITRQYTADSIALVIKNGGMEKASLMSNAFIAIQEDESHYNQIKGAEMMAYFDEKGALKRFDVLGGANALFYLEENNALATVNKAESKMLSATFKEGELQRVYYFEQAKNDGYPVVQLTSEELNLKGFEWQPDKRPADRYAVTPLSLRPSQRSSYARRPRATFVQTEKYFPGYIGDIYRQIEVRDSLRVVRERERALAERRAAEKARLDSLVLKDSLAFADSLAIRDSLALADSLAAVRLDSLAVTDSLKMASDSLAVADTTVAPVLTPEQIAAAEKAAAKKAAQEARMKAKEEARKAREAKKKKKQEELEARWAELDKRDAEKQAAKDAKKLEKERQRKRKELARIAHQEAKDAATLEKYRQKYLKEKQQSAGK